LGGFFAVGAAAGEAAVRTACALLRNQLMVVS
jgi:hypothetical protein